MAKKGFGIHDLSSELDEADDAVTPQGGATPSNRKKVSSPMNSRAMAGETKRMQRMYLDLPVSKESVECTLSEIDPAECVASPLNKRVQSLLSTEDTAVQQLMKSIEEEGQRDPVLVRPIADSRDGVRYEVVYGTRRRYAVEQLNKQQGGALKLRAWVSSRITDADAKRLADSENDDREDISSWERAQYYARALAEKPELKVEGLAALEGVDPRRVYEYLKLAALPDSVVALLATPTRLSMVQGRELSKVLDKTTPAKLEKLVAQLSENGRWDDAVSLTRAVKDAVSQRKATPKARKPVTIEAGTAKAVLTAHRTDKGRFKVDFQGLSDAQVQGLAALIEQYLGK